MTIVTHVLVTAAQQEVWAV